MNSNTNPVKVTQVANTGFTANTHPYKVVIEGGGGGGDGVTSVNGDPGPAVFLDKNDIGLGNVNNTSDLNKPISTATQAALNQKVSKSGDSMTGDLVMQLQDSTPGIPITDAQGVISVKGGDDTTHLALFVDTDGDGDYDADIWAKDNMYVAAENAIHFRPRINVAPSGNPDVGRMVYDASSNGNYFLSGVNYSGSVGADLIFARYGASNANWMKFDESVGGHTLFGGSDTDNPAARIHAKDAGATVAFLESTNATSRMTFRASGTTGNTVVGIGAIADDLVFRAGSQNVAKVTSTSLDMQSHKVTNVTPGTNPNDAVVVSQLNSSLPTITQTIGTSTSEVMSQNAVSSRLFGTVSGTNVFGDSVNLGNGNSGASGGNVVIGKNAQGSNSPSSSAGSIAIGDGSSATQSLSIAIGSGASTAGGSSGPVAIGQGSQAANSQTVAIGRFASAVSINSAALGYNSYADEDNTVSVGNSTTKRRIIRVAPGTAADNAVVLSQLQGTKNYSGQVKVNYTGLSSTNFTAGVSKILQVNAATPTIASSPTTIWPYGSPTTYDPGFYIPGAAPASTHRLRENNLPGQVHRWRIRGSYANKASNNIGQLQIRLRNPDSGFIGQWETTLSDGLTSGTWSAEITTIADPASLAAGRGYQLEAWTSFTDTNLIISVTDITRDSTANENVVV